MSSNSSELAAAAEENGLQVVQVSSSSPSDPLPKTEEKEEDGVEQPSTEQQKVEFIELKDDPKIKVDEEKAGKRGEGKEDEDSDREEQDEEEEGASTNGVKEIDKEEEWKARGKHIFILTSAGKPIFTRWGDEADFPELFGVLQILMAMVASSTNIGGQASVADALRRVTLGTSHQMYFLIEGELQYVMVTRTRESPQNCVRQLRTLHHQLVAVIPTMNKVLKRNPSYDIRTLFNHGDINVMRALIRRLNNEPGFMFRCIQPLGMPSAIRDEVGNIIVNQGYGGESHLWTLLLYGSHIVSIIAPDGEQLHAEDLLLVINFAQVCSARAGQVWAPLCLPHYNSSGYLWCFASRVDEIRRLAEQENGLSPRAAASPSPQRTEGGEDVPPSGPKLVLVQVAVGQEEFPQLRKAAMDVVTTLTGEAGVDLVQQIEQCATTTPLAIDTNVLGPSAMDLHFFMFMSSKQQMVVSQLPPYLANSKTERKALLRLLVRIKDLSQRSRAKEPILIHRSARCTIAVMLNPVGPSSVGGGGNKGSELYMVFWPCVDTQQIPVCASSLLKWLKSIENKAFMTQNMRW